MLKTGLKTMLLTAVAMTAFAGAASAGKLTIESWRNDDATIWKEKIIPAFQAKHPDITVEFNPTAPAEYNAALNARLEGGTAGDIITCRPFDPSLGLFEKGYLAPLNDLPSMAGFSDVAKSAWTTDDGKTTFCVPMASVIHGFIYNKDIFKELGLEPPKTEEEFFAVLDKIKANGTYTPLVMGTNDQWEAATMGFQNIGPNYWKGEDGRKTLIDGSAKFTDAPYIDTFKALAKWAPYLGDGFQGPEVSRQPEPIRPRQGRDLSCGFMGHLYVPRPECANGRLQAATASRRYRLLYFGPHGYRHRHERQDRERGRRQGVPRLGGLGGIRQHLRQFAAGLLPAVERQGHHFR